MHKLIYLKDVIVSSHLVKINIVKQTKFVLMIYGI